ncbi:MAG: replicative DNA helicase [Coprobacillus sp.]|nr:replicative DNA helicase [Coprobacillus sp.]
MPSRKNQNTIPFESGHQPYSEAAEQYVLGAAMVSKDALLTVLTTVHEDNFYLPKHQDIYRALLALDRGNDNVDIQTVTSKLGEFKCLERVGGSEYLNECADTVTSLLNLDYNLSVVVNNSVLRNMLNTMRDIDYQAGTEAIEDMDGFISQAELKVHEAAEKRISPYFKKASEIAAEVSEELIELEKKSGDTEQNEVVGVDTGFTTINKLTSGFKKGEVTIIGARPSVGKTALALNFAYNAATMGKVSVAIFSLEMDRKALIKRLTASTSYVNLQSLNTGIMTAQDKGKVNDGLQRVANAPIYIDDTAGANLIDIENKSRKLKASDSNLGLIIIDYLGLIATTSATRNNNDNRQEEVRKISQAVKNLARNLDIPIILVSQLSRSVDERGGDHIPQLSDLRESGAIEQDADVVMLIYRSDYYNKGEKKISSYKKPEDLTFEENFQLVQEQNEKLTGHPDPKGTSLCVLNIAKNRNGQTGQVRLFFHKSFGKFEQIPDDYQAVLNASSTPFDDED